MIIYIALSLLLSCNYLCSMERLKPDASKDEIINFISEVRDRAEKEGSGNDLFEVFMNDKNEYTEKYETNYSQGKEIADILGKEIQDLSKDRSTFAVSDEYVEIKHKEIAELDKKHTEAWHEFLGSAREVGNKFADHLDDLRVCKNKIDEMLQSVGSEFFNVPCADDMPQESVDDTTLLVDESNEIRLHKRSLQKFKAIFAKKNDIASIAIEELRNIHKEKAQELSVKFNREFTDDDVIYFSGIQMQCDGKSNNFIEKKFFMYLNRSIIDPLIQSNHLYKERIEEILHNESKDYEYMKPYLTGAWRIR